MQFKCDYFDTDVQYLSRNLYLKSLKHKKKLRKKYIINNPNFIEVDKIFSDFGQRNIRKFD